MSEKTCFTLGTSVMVKENATMWGEPTAPPSTYAGWIGTIAHMEQKDLDGYEVCVEFPDKDRGWGRFYQRELDIL